jgi:hypothetical protein
VRALLAEFPEWPGFRLNENAELIPLDIEAALRRYFDRACEELCPYAWLIEEIGDRLDVPTDYLRWLTATIELRSDRLRGAVEQELRAREHRAMTTRQPHMRGRDDRR